MKRLLFSLVLLTLCSCAPVIIQEKPLSLDALATGLRGAKSKVQVCFDQQPKVKGMLLMQFMILPSGEVAETEIITEAFKGTQVGQCALDAVNKFKFPEHSDEPVKIVYPFKAR